MTAFRRSFILMILMALLVSVPVMASALTVNTSTEVPELRGTKVSITLTLVASGVGQETKTPLGTSTVAVGESVNLGSLSDTPSRPAQLRVELPDGRFYRTVRPGELERGSIDLTIHSRGSSEQLTIREHSMLVQPFPNRMMVREVVVFRNPTDHRMGGKNDPITIDLPEGATRFSPGPGLGGKGEYRVENGTLTYNVQLAPGRSIIGFFYLVKPDGNRYQMVRRPRWPTKRYVLKTMSSDSVEISTEGLRTVKARRSRSGPAGRSKQFVAQSLKPGDTIAVTWTGLQNMSPPGGMGTPGMSSSAGKKQMSEGSNQPRPNVLSSVSWPVFLGIGISLIVFAGSYAYVQFHLKQLDSGVGGDFLVEELARLDQEYEDGAIGEAYYKRTRRRWKARAEELREGPDASPSSDSA